MTYSKLFYISFFFFSSLFLFSITSLSDKESFFLTLISTNFSLFSSFCHFSEFSNFLCFFISDSFLNRFCSFRLISVDIVYMFLVIFSSFKDLLVKFPSYSFLCFSSFINFYFLSIEKFLLCIFFNDFS